MRVFIQTIVLTLTLQASFLNTYAQKRQVQFSSGSFSEIKELAIRENKFIMVDCYTSWCGPCKRMEKTVFTNDSVADFYNLNFINVKYDMEKGEGKKISKEYNINTVPTYLFFNSEGVRVHEICGYSNPAKFISHGKDALDPDKQLTVLEETYKDGNRSADLIFSYLLSLKNASSDYKPVLEEYLNGLPKEKFIEEPNWKIIFSFLSDPESSAFINVLKNKSSYYSLYGKDSVDTFLYKLLSQKLKNLSKVNPVDENTIDKFKNEIITAEINSGEKLLLETDLIFCKQNQKWDKYAETYIQWKNQYNKDNFQELHKNAQFFLENVEDKNLLEIASTWAEESVKIFNYHLNNHTLAELYYRTGRKKEAISRIQVAIEIAKKEGFSTSNYKAAQRRFKKGKK